MGEDEGGGDDKVIPPNPPSPAFAEAASRGRRQGEGRPFIPAAELGR